MSGDYSGVARQLRDRAVILETETNPAPALVSALGAEIVELGNRLGNGAPPGLNGDVLATVRALDGARFVLEASERVDALSGREDSIAWPSGEPLLIVGPQGVGKTTLLERLALKRAGVHTGELLRMPVIVDQRRVLYIAADRPRQIARSLRRMVSEAERDALAKSLIVWPGPLPFDLGKASAGQLIEFVENFPDVGTVMIDALKDVAVGLSDDAVASTVNREFQHVISAGVELVVAHHQRKATSENRQPRTLDDVYGSTWLTAGAGSVLLICGRPGDPIIQLRHLKQPVGEIGPVALIHVHKSG